MEEFAELMSQTMHAPTLISDQVHKSFVFHAEDQTWSDILKRVFQQRLTTQVSWQTKDRWKFGQVLT